MVDANLVQISILVRDLAQATPPFAVTASVCLINYEK